ncbi:MAG: ribonuclease T [Gammaproteobacteria bacterium]
MSKRLPMAERFRGFLPVVIDVETGGINSKTDALLELAAVTLKIDTQGDLVLDQTFQEHIKPFEGANLDPKSLAFNKIDPYHPFRFALDEKNALQKLFVFVRAAKKQVGCQRAVLVGHNAWFDLAFLNAAIERTQIKNNPFHRFTCFDTATLGGVMYGQTVLSKAVQAAGLSFNNDDAHTAKYDAEQTAQLFCKIVNQWYECKTRA